MLMVVELVVVAVAPKMAVSSEPGVSEPLSQLAMVDQLVSVPLAPVQLKVVWAIATWLTNSPARSRIRTCGSERSVNLLLFILFGWLDCAMVFGFKL